MAVTPVAEPQPGRDRRVLFVGSNTAEDVGGLRWFLESVWPRVQSALPDARFRVAGPVCDAAVAVPDGVRLLGAACRLAAEYADAGVVILPQQTAAGLNLRLVEALGNGKAVVATDAMLLGSAQDLRGGVLAAHEPADFAAVVIGLLSDTAWRRERAEAALALARARLLPAVRYRTLLDLVSSAPAGRVVDAVP